MSAHEQRRARMSMDTQKETFRTEQACISENNGHGQLKDTFRIGMNMQNLS